MRDQDRDSPYNINTISSKQMMRIKKNINWGINKLIQSQILQIIITRTVWQTVRRITNEILGVQGLSGQFSLSPHLIIKPNYLVIPLSCCSTTASLENYPLNSNDEHQSFDFPLNEGCNQNLTPTKATLKCLSYLYEK